ncbi:hypothetical protein DJ84_18475 [Halorubrum ezzemoulense]|nr:hypothetical protein DJ84_18475 [Halorubrum ezzemoulense]
MGYIYNCDGFCDRVEIEDRPALTAEFNEDWFDDGAAGDRLRQAGFEAGDLVTLCPDCTERLLIHEGDGT